MQTVKTVRLNGGENVIGRMVHHLLRAIKFVSKRYMRIRSNGTDHAIQYYIITIIGFRIKKNKVRLKNTNRRFDQKL